MRNLQTFKLAGILLAILSTGVTYATSNEPGHDVHGKYTDAIAHFGCAGDEATYGRFRDWGYWGGGNYCGAHRPAGYYVWYNGSWAVWRHATGAGGHDARKGLGFDVGGKYYDAIANFGCAADVARYGEFYEYGYWGGGHYCGAKRPAGYYVWYQGAWAVWKTKVK